MEIIKETKDNKQIVLYKNEDIHAPVVYANMYTEAGKEILAKCKEIDCRPFHLVSISNLRWDEELSPWPHEKVVSDDDHFTGEARQYAYIMEEKIIPFAESEIKPSYRVISGYSMGGLFALYAPYVTKAFSKAVSASGSVWYPGFVDFAETHDFLEKPEAIYLSLGDKESHTDNDCLNQTESCMRKLCSIYKDKNINSVFELNPGNHFVDSAVRMAKGIKWILEVSEK